MLSYRVADRKDLAACARGSQSQAMILGKVRKSFVKPSKLGRRSCAISLRESFERRSECRFHAEAGCCSTEPDDVDPNGERRDHLCAVKGLRLVG